MTTGCDISVIIPARNAAATIAATLASLAPSRGLIAEVLLIDDRSSDNTAEIARAAAGADGLPLQVIAGRGAGAGAARNRGLDLATGAFVFFIDADDVALAGGLERLRAVLTAEPSLALAIGSYIRRIPGEADRVRRAQSYDRGARGNVRAYLAGQLRSVQVGAALARRTAIGPIRFPEAAIYDEDTCFWAQLVGRGNGRAIADLVAVYHASPDRMEARFIATPQRSFLAISRAYRRLVGRGLDAADAAVRRSILALTVARVAWRRGDLATARRFMRLSGRPGLPARLRYRRLRYRLRIGLASLLPSSRSSRSGAPPTTASPQTTTLTRPTENGA